MRRTRAPRTLGRLLRRVAVSLFAMAIMGGAGLAIAVWLSSGSGAAAASAGSLPQGATPSAVAADGDVTVSWSQNTVNGSFLGTQSGGGYLVTRYAQGSSTAIAPGSTCSGVVSGSTATLSCVEHSVPSGSWQYTVTPALDSWRGAESSKSAVAGAPGLAVTFPASSGSYSPATWSGGCTPIGACGTAIDKSGTGLANVKVSIRQGAGNYWNGSAFASPSEVLITATGAASWNFPFPGSNFPSDGTYTVRAVATDNHGDTSTTAVGFTFVVDSTPPTASVSFPVDGTSYRAATYNAGCSPVGICGSAADASGVQAVSVSIRRVSDGAYWNGSSFSGSTETFNAATLGSPGAASTTWGYAFALPADGSYVIHVQAGDTVGNTQTGTTYAAAAAFTIDATAPTQSLSLTAAASAYLSGTTLYWNGNNTSTGSLKLVDAVTDAGSGPASAQFPAIGTAGWAHGAETVSSGSGSPPTISYTSSPYSWGAAAANPGDQVITGSDVVGNQVTTTLHFVDDTTAPIGGALTVNGTTASAGGTSSFNTSGNFVISRSDYTDGVSGIASSQLTRRTGTLASSDGITQGTCTGYGSPTVIVGAPAQSLSGPACYLYTLTGTDNVGNQTSISTTVEVDTTGPSAPAITLSGATGNTLVNGTTVFINAQAGKSGTFSASATTTDPDTGIQRVDFPALTGFTTGGGSDTTSPYSSGTYTWSGAVGASGAQAVTSFDSAGLSTSSAFTVSPDTTGPTGAVTSPTGTISGTVSVQSSTAADTGGSGVASAAYSYCTPAPCTPGTAIGTSSTGPNYAVNWNTAPLANGSYDVRAVITDNVGNSTTTAVVAVTVANVYTFQVFSPGTRTAGTAFPSSAQSIQLLENGSVTTTLNGVAYTGNKAITFSGPGSAPDGTSPTYPATITFTNGAGTVTTNSITLVKAEAGISLTATDVANGISGSSATFTVNAGTAAGLIWTNASTKSGASTVACSGTVHSTSFTCTVTPANGSGSGRFFKANVSLIDTLQNIATNASGSAISVTITTSSGSVVGSPVSIANGASQSGTQFTVNLTSGSGSATVQANATVGGAAVRVTSTIA